MKFGLILILLFLPALQAQTYEPLTGEERLKWFAKSTYGPKSLLVAGPFSAGWRTGTNRPEEWGPGWEGFGKRYGARLVNNSVQNGTEAAFGAIWNEDPRYHRLGQGSAGKRLLHTVKYTFGSRYGDGRVHFAAAKAIGITTGAFLQKAWMPDSVTSNRDCLFRIHGSYAGRFFSNVFREFGPDIFRKFKR